MSIEVKELLEGRSVSFANGAYRSAVREFLVYETTTANIDVQEILPLAGIPNVGYMLVQGEAHPTLPDLSAQEAAIAPITDRKNAFRVSITYKRIVTYGPDADRPGYMEFSSSITAEFREVWRTDPEDLPMTSMPGNNDIGGTAVDVKGEPVSVPFTTASIQIQHVIEGNFPFSFIQSLAGRRNESAWGIYPAGTILFEGADCSSIGVGRRRLTYTFHHDPNGHLRQVSVPDFASGAAINTGTAAEYALNAYPVIHRQPFPGLADFSELGVDEILVVE